MAAKIDNFGPVSEGYDRAQIGIAPPVNNGSTEVRPHGNTPQRRQSLHVIISDNLPLIFTHPRRGYKRLKNAVGERHPKASSADFRHIAPTLAPAPPAEVEYERLHTDIEDKPKFPPVKALITSPVSTLKSFAADHSGSQFSENLAKSEVPHSASVNLLVQDHENSKASTEEEAAVGHLKLTQLKQLRQDAFVRWTVDRHVREVRRVLCPSELPQNVQDPSLGSWTNRVHHLLENRLNEHMQHYVDESGEWPNPNRKILASSFERIVVASTQIQNWYMELRAISHWDNPRKTAIYAMALLSLLYVTMTRRNRAPDLQSMWESVACSEDRAQTPRHLNELIVQYGTQGWVDHAIDRAGPALYIKLEHIADILETVQNFYEWRDPFRTTISLCILAILWLAVTILPTWILVKAGFFLIGLDFFVLSPIGYHNRRFRLLVSPFTWILWRVPTHADWALARLQAEGSEHLIRMEERGGEDVKLRSLDDEASVEKLLLTHQRSDKIGTYQCKDNPKGILEVTTTLINFAARKQDGPNWSIEANDLDSLKKISKPTRTSFSDGLQFRTSAGLEFEVMGLEKRDEIFSQIVGYSNVRWKRTS